MPDAIGGNTPHSMITTARNTLTVEGCKAEMASGNPSAGCLDLMTPGARPSSPSDAAGNAILAALEAPNGKRRV
ncbi:MAG: hypothetical protein AAFY60_22360 [Myxococcota bacterium]